MVQINFTRENSNCDISNKNILRRDLNNGSEMGNQDSHHAPTAAAAMAATTTMTVTVNRDVVEGESVDSRGTIPTVRYDIAELLALRNDPLSQMKPVYADERAFWIGGRPYVPRKKMDREKRIGSGRIATLNPEQQRLAVGGAAFRYPNPFREKTGREFCETQSNDNNNDDDGTGVNDWNVNYFNPVNRDHRRLMEEIMNNEENEPEWVKGGPTSRLDTIDLHGFQDEQIESVQNYPNKYRPQGRSTPAKFGGNGGGTLTDNLENKENHRDKYNQPFSFDEFLNSNSVSMENILPNSGQHQHQANNHVQASRYKRSYFKQRNYDKGTAAYQPSAYQAPPGFQDRQPKRDYNNSALTLLDILHGQNNNANNNCNGSGGFGSAISQQMAYKNLSQMPSANELESIWRQGSGGGSHQHQQGGDYQKLMQQMDFNKNFLAGKSVVEVLGVLAQSQLRQKQQQQQQQQMMNFQNQWAWMGQARPGANNANAIKNNQINQMQMARILERQLQIQGQVANPNGFSPYNPQYWEKIQQQQQAYYQQYEKNMANRMVRAKFPGRTGRHVKFEDSAKLENFFTPEVVAQASAGQLPVIDTEKAIKVEEFERKIKEVAATCCLTNKKQ